MTGRRTRVSSGAALVAAALLAGTWYSDGVAAQSPSGIGGASEPISLVVIGDSIPHPGFCPECTGWVVRYAADLQARTAREVQVHNRSRNDSATLPMIQEQVVGEAAIRTEIADADIVIESAGYNNLLPDPTVDVGCTDPEWGTTDADFITWSLTRTTAECIQAGFDAYAADYDTLFSEITGLLKGQSIVLVALGVHNGNRGHPWLAATGLPQADIDRFEAYMEGIYDRWNTMLCERASTAGFTCVDTYHLFNGPSGQEAPYPWTIDGAHPSDAGSDAIARLLGQLDVSAIANVTAGASRPPNSGPP